MAHIMNMDRCVNPRPVTFVNSVAGLERGLFLEIVGMAANNVFGGGADDFEAYKVKLATASTKAGDLVINTTVPKQYDERLEEKDFVMAEGAMGRAHYITTGDEYTLAKDFVTGVTAVGDEVELVANGKLAKKASGTAIGEIVKIYKWNGQDSVMIRFY